MSKIISDQIEKTQTLLNGLKNKIELLKNKGLDEEFINKLSADNRLMENYNTELDKLKTELKAKTIASNKKMIEIKTRIKEAKKIIKNNYLQNEWKDFGITDKR